MNRFRFLAGAWLLTACGCNGDTPREVPAWEMDNPIRALAAPPLGMELYFAEATQPPSPTRVRLGRWLFYDTRLSGDGSISCASCHRPEFAFSEPLSVPIGIGRTRGTRKTPSVVNLAVTPRLMSSMEPPVSFLFWDGRATSLEEQALGPIQNAAEMGSSHAAMVTALAGITGYGPYFREAFGSDGVTAGRVAAAIADYERTRMSGNSPYDRWRFNRDGQAVSVQAKRGHDIFFDKGRCSLCHTSSNFTDTRFHNLGIGWDSRTKQFKDVGRFAVTGAPADLGAFKTPGLREVSRRAPYMHDGSLATLHEVVEFYNKGANENPQLSARLVPLGLSRSEVDAVVAFLKTLEGAGYEDQPPRAFPQ